MPGEPEQKEKKDAIGPDHLRLFGPREGGTKCDPKCRGGDIVTKEIQKADQQPTHNEKKPKGEGNLLGGEKSKANKSRIKIDLEFLKAGKKPMFWEVGTCKDQCRDLRNRRDIEIKSVYRMET